MPGTAQKEAAAEALALLAQQGDKEAAGLLWEKVYKLYYMKAAKIYQKRREQFIRCGVELEDIQQECFLAFQASLRAFDPARGYKFTAWLSYPLQNRINALMHCRGSMKPEPLDSADSLEKPIPGTEEDLTIGDTLEDPEAGEMLRNAEDRVFTEELHNALIECLATLPEAQRTAIEGRHFEGKTLKQLGEERGCSPEWVRRNETDGMRKLRRGKNIVKLKPFMEEITAARAYHGTGFTAWKSRGSVEERVTEYKESKGWLRLLRSRGKITENYAE